LAKAVDRHDERLFEGELVWRGSGIGAASSAGRHDGFSKRRR
jgi:hypothetical protein